MTTTSDIQWSTDPERSLIQAAITKTVQDVIASYPTDHLYANHHGDMALVLKDNPKATVVHSMSIKFCQTVLAMIKQAKIHIHVGSACYPQLDLELREDHLSGYWDWGYRKPRTLLKKHRLLLSSFHSGETCHRRNI